MLPLWKQVDEFSTQLSKAEKKQKNLEKEPEEDLLALWDEIIIKTTRQDKAERGWVISI